MVLQAIDAVTPSTVTLVKEALQKAIMMGELLPGSRLLQEELCRDLGVSRQPLREALRQLQSEGLVEARGRRGGYTIRTYTAIEIQENYDLRMLLEGRAAGFASLHIDGKMIARLRAINELMANATSQGQGTAILDLNRQFHSVIWNEARQPILRGLLDQLWSSVTTFTPLLVPERAAAAVREHERVIVALEAHRQHDAIEAMAGHVGQARVEFEQMRGGSDQTDPEFGAVIA